MSMPSIVPLGSIRPITRKRAPATRTNSPSGLASPNSSRASFWPSTQTGAPRRGSPGGQNVPCATRNFQTRSISGVTP